MTPNNRLGTKSIHALLSLLTDRDHAILQSIYDHKFLTTKQIYTLHFWNHDSYASGIRACTRVLARLHGHRLLHRLDRPVGGSSGGSTSYVWGLDAAGDRLVRHQAASPPASKRSRTFEPTTYFLAHTLAIADIRVQLEVLAREGHFELLSVQTEPSNWRPFLSRTGAEQILKPDLYVATSSNDYEDHYFLEIDRSTESLPTLIGQCLLYERSRANGTEHERLGVYPLVLWLLPNANRRAALAKAIQTDKRLTSSLFVVLAPEDLRRYLINRQTADLA